MALPAVCGATSTSLLLPPPRPVIALREVHCSEDICDVGLDVAFGAVHDLAVHTDVSLAILPLDLVRTDADNWVGDLF